MEARIIKLIECIESNKSHELSQIAAFQLGQLAKEHSSGIIEKISPLLFYKTLEIQQSAALAFSEVISNTSYQCITPASPLTFSSISSVCEEPKKRLKTIENSFSDILNTFRSQVLEGNWEEQYGSLLGFKVLMKNRKLCKECEEDIICRVILAIEQDQTADYSDDLPAFPIRKLGAEVVSLSSATVSANLEEALLCFLPRNTLGILLCFRKAKIYSTRVYNNVVRILRERPTEDSTSEALHYLVKFPLVKDQSLADLILSLIDESDSLSSFIKYAIKVIDKLFNLNCELPNNYSKIYSLFTHSLTEVRLCTFSAFTNLVHKSCIDVPTVFLLTTQALLLETNPEILKKAQHLAKYLIKIYDLKPIIKKKIVDWNGFLMQKEPNNFDFFVVNDRSVSVEELYSFADNNTEEDIKSQNYLAKKQLERTWRIGKMIAEAAKVYGEVLVGENFDKFLRILAWQSKDLSEIYNLISVESAGKIESIRIRAVAVYKVVKISLNFNLELPDKISNILQSIVTAYKYEIHTFFKYKLAKTAARLTLLLKSRNCNEKFLSNLIKISPFLILKSVQEVHKADTPRVLSLYQDLKNQENLLLITENIHPSLGEYFIAALPLIFEMLPSEEVSKSLISIFSQVLDSIPYLVEYLLEFLKMFPLPFNDPLIILKQLLRKQIVAFIPYSACILLPLLSHLNTSSGNEVAEVFSEILYAVMLDSSDSEIPERFLEYKRNGMEFLANLKGVYTLPKYVPRVNLNKMVLRDYQNEGIAWMRFLAKFRLGGMLCDEMGLGKTIQSLCAIAEAHLDYKDKISLIICPASIVGHWLKEARTYLHMRVSEGYCENFTTGLMVISYSSLLSTIDKLSSHHFLYVVLDEGHLLSNPKTKTYKSVKMLQSQFRLILTGTPIQNKILELWPFFDFLMPGFLGTQTEFSTTYQKYLKPKKSERTIKFNDEYQALRKLNTLHKKILPFVLRRLKKDILHDLPDKIIQDYYVELNPQQKMLLERFYEQGPQSQLKEYNFLKKLCNHPLLIDPSLVNSESPKIEALKELLNDCEICEESGTAHKALIFTKMKKMLDIIERDVMKQVFPLTQYLRLDGSTPLNKRFDICEDFNKPQYRLMLMTTETGGLGLNLQAADVVLFVDHSWNPVKDLQAMDRTHRIGQKNVVNVYRLITKNTLEEEILGLQAFKTKIAEALVNTENSSMEKVDPAALLNSVAENL